MNTDYSELEDLQSYYSDFHKSIYGFRPRYHSEEFWNSEVLLQKAIDDLHADIKRQQSTFEGRERLRDDGWVVDAETDPEYVKLAELGARRRVMDRAMVNAECYGWEYSRIDDGKFPTERFPITEGELIQVVSYEGGRIQ